MLQFKTKIKTEKPKSSALFQREAKRRAKSAGQGQRIRNAHLHKLEFVRAVCDASKPLPLLLPLCLLFALNVR